MERVRLRRVFDAGLAAVTGYVLPIVARTRPAAARRRSWVSGPWFFRDDRMYLIPGDSPMGYRLPLDSLPWVSETDYPYQHRARSVRAARAVALRRRSCACSTSGGTHAGGDAAMAWCGRWRDGRRKRHGRRSWRWKCGRQAVQRRSARPQPQRHRGGAARRARDGRANGKLDSPHRAVRGGARPGARGGSEGRDRDRSAAASKTAARVHAAADRTRRLSRPARRRRSDGGRTAA